MQPTSYTSFALWLHWIIVGLVVIEYTIVALMPDLRSNDNPTGIIDYHMSVGIVILLVMLVRIVWRMTHTPPAHTKPLSRLQRILANLTHEALYILLTIMPVLGWVWASSRGWTVTLFNLVTLPSLVSVGDSIGRIAGGLHSLCGGLIVLLVALHIVAALYHQFIVKDGVLARMVPWLK